MRFLDTNIFLRYLVESDPSKTEACAHLFQRLEAGEEAAVTSEAVLTEIAYVLRSKAQYGLPTSEIVDMMRPILSVRGIRIPHKESCLKALDVWEANPSLDFEDALTVAHMGRLGITEVLSYDRDFDGVRGISRVEP